MLLVAEMMSQFTIKRTLNQSFGELLEQAILTEQIVQLLTVLRRSSSSSGLIGGIICSSFRD
jgi:hypothetical protein